jgi:hypothetical protein
LNLYAMFAVPLCLVIFLFAIQYICIYTSKCSCLGSCLWLIICGVLFC